MKLTFRATITMSAAALAVVALMSAGRVLAEDGVKLPNETLAADSQANFDQGNHLLHSGSSQTDMQAATEGLEKLGAGGHLTILEAGTQVKPINPVEVRVIAGPHAGQVWWLFKDEDVRKPGEVPPGSVELR
jgi:hypothetical protein